MNLFSVIIPLITSIMSLSMGTLLFSLKMPKNKALTSYKKSRQVMACVYISLGIMNAVQVLLGNNKESSEALPQILSGIYIIVASLQALLLSYSFITLIDAYYVTWKKIIIQIIPIVFFSTFTLIGLSTHNLSYLEGAILAFSIYYLFQLVMYTRIFFLKEKRFIVNAKDYYSENEDKRIKWVRTSFLLSLFIGLWAFSIVLFPSAILLEQTFSVLCILFYLYFGIHFINYVPTFHLLMPIIAPEKELVVKEKMLDTLYNKDLHEKLAKWIDNKLYKQTGITINELAEQINTNRTYISNYINTNEGVNFNRWLNALRIQEAKKEMISCPKIPLNELASLLGYTDQSCFSKQFKSIEGQSPISWKRENIN